MYVIANDWINQIEPPKGYIDEESWQGDCPPWLGEGMVSTRVFKRDLDGMEHLVSVEAAKRRDMRDILVVVYQLHCAAERSEVHIAGWWEGFDVLEIAEGVKRTVLQAGMLTSRLGPDSLRFVDTTPQLPYVWVISPHRSY